MIEFDFSGIKKAYRDFWDGKLGRPVMNTSFSGKLTDMKEPQTPPFRFMTAYDLSISPKQIVERVNYDLSKVDYEYEGFPQIHMSFFGPGVAAAFMGATPHPAEHTVWFEADKILPIKELHLEYKPDNIWFKRVKEIYCEGVKKWGGNVLLPMTDLGGGLDILASFRGTENLLIDCIEEPEEVLRCVNEIRELWFRYYNEINEIIEPITPGYSTWSGVFDEKPTYILQSDFSYMIGPDMFRDFVKEDLKDSARRLTNAVYHMDGIGQIPHLDMLLDIDAIKMIQWVPGSGEPSDMDWTDLYKKIAEGNKKLYYIFGAPEKLPYVFSVTNSRDGAYMHMGCEFDKKTEYMENIKKYLG